MSGTRLPSWLVLSGLLGVITLVCAPPSIRAQEPVEPEPVVGEQEQNNDEITPGGAFLRSLILPGWGHAATGAHFRGAFYVAAQSGAVWMLTKSMAQHREAGRFRAAEVHAARERFRTSGVVRPDSLRILAERDPGVEAWDELIEARSQQVEDWASLAIFLVLLGATDAFVAGHLMDHPEPLSMDVAPLPGGGWSFRVSLPPSAIRSLRR